ncbi:MAG: glycosyltransferase family 2 protein [Acidobacteriota bacterium]
MNQHVDSWPFVSVVIPVRNEAVFIADLIGAILEQDYPADRLEVIVADGQSTDGTREALASLQARHSRLLVVDNPGRIVSTGLNIAVARSKGDVIIRIDGHALIAPDFIRQNVALLAAHPEAWIVGGPIQHAATTTLGKAVAVAMSHPLGVGNARHRFPGFEGYVESAQFPALRRWVFDRVGLFDERLVRNQDDEFNYRIGQAGGKIFISPSVKYSYFVRERLGQLFKQYFQYGFWRIPVVEKHGRPTTLRQMAPTLFYLACVVLALAGLWWREPLLAVGLPLLYATGLLLAGVHSVRRNDLRVSSCVPIAIATMHAGYALGLGYGLWARFFRAGAWDAQGKMAAISR